MLHGAWVPSRCSSGVGTPVLVVRRWCLASRGATQKGGPPSRTTEDVVGAERTTEKVHFVDQPVEPPPVASRTSPLDGATQDKRAVAVRDVFVNGPVNDGP